MRKWVYPDDWHFESVQFAVVTWNQRTCWLKLEFRSDDGLEPEKPIFASDEGITAADNSRFFGFFKLIIEIYHEKFPTFSTLSDFFRHIFPLDHHYQSEDFFLQYIF